MGSKEKDHEVSMAKSQVRNSIINLKRVQKVLSTMSDDDNLPAWLQAKITDTEHNTDAAAGYMSEGKSKCGEGEYWCKTDEKCKKIPKGHHIMPNGNLMSDDEHEESGDVSEGKRDGKSAKDKGYSLRDWFKGGGWVQTGGKYDGKPCAKQPGQKTKPYCRDADDRAAMSKKERNKRARKKRKEDPNPNRKGKAKNVRQESYSNWREDLQEKIGIPTGRGTEFKNPDDAIRKIVPGAVVVPSTPKKSASVRNAHFEPEGELIEYADGGGQIGKGSVMAGPKAGEFVEKLPGRIRRALNKKVKPGFTIKGNEIQINSYEPEGKVVFEGIPHNAYKVGEQIPASATEPKPNKRKFNFEVDKTGLEGPKDPLQEGKKDACYKKVKASAKVWPSAYASGRLVQCRKKGAANYGKSKKNEEYDTSNWKEDFKALEFETVNIIEPEPIKGGQKIDEKCWVGYKQLGMKKKGKKMVPNCVKEGYSNWREELAESGYDSTRGRGEGGYQPTEYLKISNPKKRKESMDFWKQHLETAPPVPPVRGASAKSAKKDNQLAHFEPEGEIIEGAAWTKKSGKNPKGGLNEKGRKSYERENPGSDLKAPSKEKGNKRRKSFCARMKGMKKKLTSKKTANDPDSRINKSLRAWNC